jgi:hypothetical protein
VLTHAVDLHAAVLEMIDPFPGQTMAAADLRVTAGLSYGKALHECTALAADLNSAYEALADRATDSGLQVIFKRT